MIYGLVYGIIPGILFIKSQTYESDSKSALLKLNDEELINIYKSNQNQKVIAILFDRYIHLVFAGCMKYLKNEEDSQDTAMEVFESLSEKILKYTIDHFNSWLYITTKNACLMKLRKQKPIDRIENLENITQHSVEYESFLHLDNKDDNQLVVLSQFLSNLKEKQRICIELMYIKDKSYKEIALETGFELKHVKSYIQNGKRNLKQMFEKHYEQKGRK